MSIIRETLKTRDRAAEKGNRKAYDSLKSLFAELISVWGAGNVARPHQRSLPLPSKTHHRTRPDHASEDYIEAIAEAIDDHGQFRALDLVTRFAVTDATVNYTIARL
ncbi:hypothetical protein [Neorhodopirellula pilleata]|nr:hypothetical protein [Neorhodopirellula pilleata]